MMRLEFNQSHVVKDLVGPDKDLGIYSVCSGKQLEDVLQGSSIV